MPAWNRPASAPRSHRMGRSRWSPSWRRFLVTLLVTILLGPAAVMLLYRVVPPPVTPLMLKRDLEGYGLDHRWVPLTAISPWLPRAVIAGEDNLFCRHHGFDWQALRGQIDTALAGGHARGASTITMQTAKNVFLLEGRNPLRKLLEAWLAPQLELLWGKERIIEVYLNVIELGPGIYGAQAAARRYFHKPARELTEHEAALLAAILPAPLRWQPTRPTRYIAARARTIETRIGQLGPLLDCAP